jgi:hypothetical protein
MYLGGAGLNLGWDTEYSEGVSWVFSVLPDKYQDRISV